jgi:zinc transport system ATP-binding protein
MRPSPRPTVLVVEAADVCTEPILTVTNLSVRFGETVVLRDVNLSVPERAALAVIGPNGSGKTVLFKALIGALPYEGEIRWRPGTRLGYVPQKLDLERDVPITGLDFLRARANLARRGCSDLQRALDLVGVTERTAGGLIETLSGGQFQRLLMAFALIADPTVLLLDEPTAGVDEPGQEQLYELVRRLHVERGLTVLFISHELSVVYRYASNVLCLGRGRSCVGPPTTVLTPELLKEMYGTNVHFHIHEP